LEAEFGIRCSPSLGKFLVLVCGVDLGEECIDLGEGDAAAAESDHAFDGEARHHACHVHSEGVVDLGCGTAASTAEERSEGLCGDWVGEDLAEC
jgi:hypothetical protein